MTVRASILCPHCEKPLDAEHDEKACRRRMSRRFFFGLAVAPLAAAIAAKLPSEPATLGLRNSAQSWFKVLLLDRIDGAPVWVQETTMVVWNE